MKRTSGQAMVQMLDRMMGADLTGPANAIGEIKGLGPSWVCDKYATTGHDYQDCDACYNNYETDFLANLKGAKA
jgi:hypothetical protein